MIEKLVISNFGFVISEFMLENEIHQKVHFPQCPILQIQFAAIINCKNCIQSASRNVTQLKAVCFASKTFTVYEIPQRTVCNVRFW